MRTQFDQRQRVVALSNLEGMCAHVSGVCHVYEVTKVSRSRVHVTYSNPDEYGNDSPMTAVFPCYPCDERDSEARAVVLDYLRILHDNWHGEGWQAFEILRDCPELWRSGPDSNDWATREEIEASKA